MQEREIFLCALEIDDPKARAAHLSAACAGDAELQARVESLLASHEGPSQFLKTPAVRQLADDSETDIDATILHGDGSACDEEAGDMHSEEANPMNKHADDEIPLGYLQPSDKPDSLGRLGHYEILEVVGRGAFGTVLRAFDEKLQRVVAIKVLAPEMAATSPARKRFLREARTSAAVRHENVVSIYAVEDEPIPYLVMEYIPGKTLQERLDEQGPLDLSDVLRLGKQVADGLAAAHAEGLIHRDIKPGNILLEGGMNDRVKITDFGLARTADDASMTQSGMIAGTPLYMAPEQAHGPEARPAGRPVQFRQRAVPDDQRPPAVSRPIDDGGAQTRCGRHAAADSGDHSRDAGRGCARLIGHLHAKDPDERYGSAKEVSDLLAQCLADVEAGRTPNIPAPAIAGGEPSEQPAEPAVRREPQRLWHKPITKVAAALLVLLAGVAFTEATGVTKVASTVLQIVIPGQGTLVIETNDPGISISIDGEEITIQGAGVKELILRPGDYQVAATKDGKPLKQEIVTITRDGRKVLRIGIEPDPDVPNPAVAMTPRPEPIEWPLDAPPLAIAPFDAAQAKDHQQAWADYLGVPVEYTNSIGMKFRLIPPSEYLRGIPPEEIEAALAGDVSAFWRERIESDGPQHKVILTQPFYLGVTEVSQSEYEQVIGSNPSYFSPMGDGKDKVERLDTSRHPVEMVSWCDAAEFCAKLSQKEERKPFYFRAGNQITALTGDGYRLPTSAEWEFACRAGTTTKFCNGDQDQELKSVGWTQANSGRRTHAAGELLANPFGLYDLHGNVREWIEDVWLPTAYKEFAHQPAIDPVAKDTNVAARLMRGGDWHLVPETARSGNGGSPDSPTHRMSFGGFRVVLVFNAVRQAMKSTDVGGRSQLEPIQWPADAPPLAIAPFDAEQARKHQQAWAEYLGVPMEQEVVLGGRDKDGLDIKLTLVLIPPGEFLMGSSDEQIARLREAAKASGLQLRDFKWIELEGPQRRVRMTRPFYVSHTEITNDQFRSFVEAADFKTEAEASGKGSWTLRQGRMVLDPTINWHTAPNTVPNSPVTHVTWNDANACCRWLSGRNADLTFDLPTEAQWEYACRAGTTTAWFCGDDEAVLEDYAVVSGGWRWVGSKKPNAFGLYDMHGNMWEWCRDSIGNYRDAEDVDPVGPDGEKRILRGGNCFGGHGNDWHNNSGDRSAARYEAPADHSVMDKSFRVMATLPDELIAAKLATPSVELKADSSDSQQ